MNDYHSMSFNIIPITRTAVSPPLVCTVKGWSIDLMGMSGCLYLAALHSLTTMFHYTPMRAECTPFIHLFVQIARIVE